MGIELIGTPAYTGFMLILCHFEHLCNTATWQSAAPVLFFTMPRLCPRLSDQQQRDGWPQHMVPHEFHHSPKLHGQNTPRGHNHDGDPDVWIKILSLKWRSIRISSTYKSQLCKFWDVLFSSFKFCILIQMNLFRWIQWDPNGNRMSFLPCKARCSHHPRCHRSPRMKRASASCICCPQTDSQGVATWTS